MGVRGDFVSWQSPMPEASESKASFLSHAANLQVDPTQQRIMFC